MAAETGIGQRGSVERVDLEAAVARAGDGAFAVGADGRITLWNRAAERLLGYAAREVLGKPCCLVFAGRDDRGNRVCYDGCQVRALIGMGEGVQSFDMRTRTKNGRPVWLNVSTLALANGKPAGSVTLHLFRDVTATRELLGLVHEKLAAAASDGHPPPADVLTRREIDVLRLLAAGASTKAMADQLHVSLATVRNHVQNITGKLGVHSRLEAVAHAHRHRLL